jgi:hypothetical protein
MRKKYTVLTGGLIHIGNEVYQSNYLRSRVGQEVSVKTRDDKVFFEFKPNHFIELNEQEPCRVG